MYKLAAIGLGHWFGRLYHGLLKNGNIKVAKAAAASPFESKKELLEKLGVTRENYFMVQPHAPLEDRFFDGVDVVYISDPNEFHSAQTLQALSKGKPAVVEKTFGVNKEDFYSVVNYAKKNKLENKLYLHLHYLSKILAIELPGLLDRLVAEYGKITYTYSKFFEKENEDDERRSKWLFSMANGGLFMDWIHPFELYYKASLASTVRLDDVELFAVNQKYDSTNPTGIHAMLTIGGKYFAGDVKADVKIAKGLPSKVAEKTMVFRFESGKSLILKFVDSEVEFTTENRGSWKVIDEAGNVLQHGEPKGPDTAEKLASDIEKICKGMPAGISLNDVLSIFDIQWEYQEMAKGKEIVTEKELISKFILS